MTKLTESTNVQISSLLHSGFQHPVTRKWQQLSNTLTKESLLFPVFIHDKDDEITEITAMPGQYRYGINTIKQVFTPLVELGLKSVLLFGVLTNGSKDECGTSADSVHGPVIQAIRIFRKEFPQLLVCCDLCLCPYTSHGHCGILDSSGHIDNLKSIERLSQVALAYAVAGCQIIAPSDMMDGRIRSMKQKLLDNGFGNKVAVLAYSAKFASSFYGPFRDAAASAPAFGDRKCYQLPPHARGLARRALVNYLIVSIGITHIFRNEMQRKELIWSW